MICAWSVPRGSRDRKNGVKVRGERYQSLDSPRQHRDQSTGCIVGAAWQLTHHWNSPGRTEITIGRVHNLIVYVHQKSKHIIIITWVNWVPVRVIGYGELNALTDNTPQNPLSPPNLNITVNVCVWVHYDVLGNWYYNTIELHVSQQVSKYTIRDNSNLLVKAW